MTAGMIRVGELVELGEWHRDLTDLGTAKERLGQAFLASEVREGIEFGQLTFEDLPLDHDRVPKPAPEGMGRMLVCWAEVKRILPDPSLITDGSWLHDLEPKDLQRLRRVTRMAHHRLNPGKPPLSDKACDEWIDRVGPRVAVATLREAVDDGAV